MHTHAWTSHTCPCTHTTQTQCTGHIKIVAKYANCTLWMNKRLQLLYMHPAFTVYIYTTIYMSSLCPYYKWTLQVKNNYIICMYTLLPSLASIVNNCTVCLPCMWLCVMCVCVWEFVSAAQNNAMKMWSWKGYYQTVVVKTPEQRSQRKVGVYTMQ